MAANRIVPIVVMAMLCVGSSAFAQATRTWVSGVGDDANPCSRTAPCKTFAGAISKTAPSGEIDALDPGGFGAVTITKAITIDGRSTLGGVLVTATNGITVNAGATDTVILRGLDIICPVNTGTTTSSCGTQSGVKYLNGGLLVVEDTTIGGFGGPAIDFQPATAGPILLVKHVTASGNGTGINVGLMGQAAISKSNFYNDGTGVLASGTALVSIFDSVFAGNATAGVRAMNTAAINMNRGLISGNGVGVQGDSTVRISDVMIGHNTTGVAGTVVSFGNNRIAAGNITTDGAPSATLPQQ